MIVTTIGEYEKCSKAINLMKVNGFDQLPVVSTDTKILHGMVTVDQIMAKIHAGVADLDSPVSKVLLNKYPRVKLQDQLGSLIKLLRSNPYAAIVDPIGNNEVRIVGIITHIDILDYMSKIDIMQQ